MKKMTSFVKGLWRSGSWVLFVIGLCGILTACIDDDMDDCGLKSGVEYELDLETNLTTEVSTQLTSIGELKLGEKFTEELSKVFKNHASDVDLSFFVQDSIRAHHEVNVINDTAASYTIHLPARDYMHLSVANLQQEPGISLQGDERASTMHLKVAEGDTIKSQKTGVFAARLAMEVQDKDQTFNIGMYMVNCSASLVLERDTTNIVEVRGYVKGLATNFYLQDSVFTYDREVLVEQDVMIQEEDGLYCLYCVSFPSRDVAEPKKRRTRPVPGLKDDEEEEDVTDPSAEGAIWQYEVYVSLKDGSMTKNTIYVKTPLQAGMVKLLKATIDKEGGLHPQSNEMGVSVELDWKEGDHYEEELG